MIKKLTAVIIVLAIGGAIFWATKNFSANPTSTTESQTEVSKIKIDPVLSGQTLPLSNDPKDIAWNLFQKYVSYNKIKDLNGVKSVVYKIASVCEDPKTRIDCEARMALAYSYGSAIKKESLTNLWEDNKQIILSSDFQIKEDNTAIGRNRIILFFVKTDSGLKLLSFSPFKGAVADKGTASKEELLERLSIYTEDFDQDGISDYDEQCLRAVAEVGCVKTDPKNRDTDGDGFWDGIQALMSQSK
jgi:hypothetical protein